MSLDDRFFCTPQTAGYITTLVDCAFQPAETKRVFLVKKGFVVEDASDNLNSLSFWENAIASGDVIVLPDGAFVDVTTNFQEGTIGTKTIKISDGETMVSYQGSFVACQVQQFELLENNQSLYDMFIVTAVSEIIGKYDPDADTFSPIQINSIDVRSKPLFNDGTAVEQIVDTVIIRYNEIQAKQVRYVPISDPVANVTGLRAVLLEVQTNDTTTVTIKAVTACEGIEVNDLTDTSDWLILDSSNDSVEITSVTADGNGIYTLEAALTALEVYEIELDGVASNNESYTVEPIEYTAV